MMTADRAARIALLAGLCVGANVRARPRDECTRAVELPCGDGVRWIALRRTIPVDFGTQEIAQDQEEWHDLWRYFALPGPAPFVDFAREYVVARVGQSPCAPMLPSLRVCADGDVELRIHPVSEVSLCNRMASYDSDSRSVWVIAVSRQRQARAFAVRPSAPTTDDDESAACSPELSQDELLRRSSRPHESAAPDFAWQASVGAFGGVSTIPGAAGGVELRGGVRYALSSAHHGGELVGNLVGADVRARAVLGGGTVEARFLVGLSPWWMTRNDWVFHRLGSAQPTLLGVLVPEGGLLVQGNGSIGGYLGWSVPIALRVPRHFYRSRPYVIGEHWAFELAPGALLFFEQQGQSAVFTLTASAGLW